MKKWLCSLLSALVASALVQGEPASLALTNVTIIDTTGRQPGRRATVVIRGERISEIGPPDAPVPEGAEVVDGADKFLLPGLWDMHMHLSYMTEHSLPLLIANGVTGVRDMGGDLEQIDRWREDINAGARIGPRIVRAGPVLDGPRPEEAKFRLIVKNPAEARDTVAMLKKRGVDLIKVYHFLSRDSYFAIADEAKKQGIPFAGHIPNGVAPREAAEAGQRSLEHVTVLLQALIALEKKEGRTSKELTAAAFDALEGETGAALSAAMVKNGAWHTPTLVLAQSFLLRAELAAKPDDRRKYMAPEVKELWDKNNPVPASVSPEEMAERKQGLQRMVGIVGRMHRAGVPMLAGTDPPTRDVFPGFSLHDELGLLVQAGLTPLQALQAGTLNAAKCLGLADSHGTVEKGKVADLLLLDADPVSDIANTQKIAAVIWGGKILPRPALQGMLAKTEEAVKAK